MSNIRKIVESISSHEISKQDAIHKLNLLFDLERKAEAIEFQVENVSFSVHNNHGYITAIIPYGYDRIKEIIKVGSKIDVKVLY